MNKIKKIPINIGLAYLYASLLVTIIMLPYVPDNIFAVILSFLGEAMVFFLLYKTKNSLKKYVSSFLFLASFLLAFYTFSLNINGTPFYTWLLTGYDFDPMFNVYIMLMFVIVSIFSGVSLFYFNYYYFRGYIIIALMLVPIALYYKMIEVLPVIYILLTAIVLFAMYIYQVQFRNITQVIFISDKKRKKTQEDVNNIKFVANRSFYKALVALILIVTLAVAITPKSEVAKYKETFDEYISMNPFSNKNLNTISRQGNTSASENYGYFNKNRVLFDVNAFEDLYLRRSSFTKYTGKLWDTYYQHQLDSDWERKNASKSPSKIMDTFKYLYDMCPEVFEKYNVSKEEIPDISEESYTAEITSKNFSTDYYLNTIGTYRINKNNTVMNQFGCLKNNSNATIRNSYTITYYRDIARSNTDIINFASKFTGTQYIEFLNDLYSAYNEDNEQYDDVSKLLRILYSEAYQANQEMNENKNYSPKLKQLAEEITAGLETDYEKAVALERYFTENGYVYNLAYEPEIDSIEYFVFESKTGSCGQYATAMTLMANSIGINARYVEGFAMTKHYSDGTYYISAGDAHAYVEVYLPGYGYTVFEPTVRSTESRTEGNISNFISNLSGAIEIGKHAFIYFAITAVFVITILILFRIFLYNKIKNIIMIRKCKKKGMKSENTYVYIQKAVSKNSPIDPKNMTPSELNSYLNERYDINIKALVDILERKVYGGDDVEIEDEFINKLPDIILTIKNKDKEEKKKEKRKEKETVHWGI